MAGTVVVTGINSFVGHHVVEAFAGAGYRVVGAYWTEPDRLDPLRLERWRQNERHLARALRLDILDEAQVAELARQEQPGHWVQVAGLGRDFASDGYDMVLAHRLNVLCLDGLYRALAASGSALLAVGSGMEYGRIDRPHPEDAICWPDSPYGLAKLAATLRMRQLAIRTGVPTRVARVYTVFGEHDSLDRLVTRLFARLRQAQTIGLAPGVSRDVCDMQDVAQGFLRMAIECRTGPIFDTFNLSRGTATPLSEIALAVADLVGADHGLVADDPMMHRPNEPLVICGASDKARYRLGWWAKPIQAGLARLATG